MTEQWLVEGQIVSECLQAWTRGCYKPECILFFLDPLKKTSVNRKFQLFLLNWHVLFLYFIWQLIFILLSGERNKASDTENRYDMNKKHMLDRLIAKHIWNPIAWSKHEPDANPPPLKKTKKRKQKKKKTPKKLGKKQKKQNQKTPNQYQYFHFTYYRH